MRADTSRGHQRRRAVFVRKFWIRAELDKESHQLGIAAARRHEEWRRPDEIQRRNTDVRAARDACVHVCAMGLQLPYKSQAVHGPRAVRRRIVAAGAGLANPREVMESRPALCRGVWIGARVEQRSRELEMRAPYGEHERARSTRWRPRSRTAATAGAGTAATAAAAREQRIINVCAAAEERLHRGNFPFASGE